MCRKDGVQVFLESIVAKEEKETDGPEDDAIGGPFDVVMLSLLRNLENYTSSSHYSYSCIM